MGRIYTEYTVPKKPQPEYTQEYPVTASNPDAEGIYPREIGVVKYREYRAEAKKPAWTIAKIGTSNQFKWDSESVQGMFFTTKEAAAAALFTIWNGIEANPCPPRIAAFLEDEARDLRELTNETRKAFFRIRQKRQFLQRLAKEYHLDLGFYLAETDSGTPVTKLRDFFDEHLDEIYDCMGKDWARTFRALVAGIVREIDPEAAENDF